MDRAIVIVGAGGFIGSALALRLAAQKRRVVAVMRTARSLAPGIESRAAADLSGGSDWPALVGDAGAVVHLASRAHMPAERGDAWIAAEAARATALAHAARAAGARIVLMSSVKVHGEDSGAGRFRAADVPRPADAYGVAKLRIEEAMAAEDRAALVILRPPLVHGPGAKGNLRALIDAVQRGIPLPLARIANRRSLIGLDNLIDLVECVLEHPQAPGGTFLLRDDEEVATPELVRLIARALDRPARLFAIPASLLAAAARLTGRGDALLGSLVIDDGPTRAMLGWRPRLTLAAGIDAMCRPMRRA